MLTVLCVMLSVVFVCRLFYNLHSERYLNMCLNTAELLAFVKLLEYL